MKQTTGESTTTKEEIKMEAVKKTFYTDAKVKELLAQPDIQAAMRTYISVPEIVIIKKVGKASTEHHTQKIEYMAGETIMDAIHGQATITDDTHTQFIDPVNAINKKYRIVDYAFALEANMSGKDFQGYSATGLKLNIKKLEEVK